MTSKQKSEQRAVLAAAHIDYAKLLQAHALFKIHDRDTGEDLVQETFIKTWRYLVRGGKIDVMKAFLYHVLNDLIVDEYRKRKTVSLDALLEKGFEPKTADVGRASDILDGKAAASLIEKLPGKYRNVVSMKCLEDLSLTEISQACGQTKNAIAVRLHRGLAKLKLLHAALDRTTIK